MILFNYLSISLACVFVLIDKTMSSKNRLFFDNNFHSKQIIYLVKDEIISAVSGRQIIINVPQDLPFNSLTYNCSMSHYLENEFNIIKAEFCHTNYIGDNENCFNIIGIDKVRIEKKYFNVQFNKLSGFTVSTSLDWDIFKEGFYSCKIENKYESLQSNLFKIRLNETNEELKRHLIPNQRTEYPQKHQVLNCGTSAYVDDVLLTCNSFASKLVWIACHKTSDFQSLDCLGNQSSQIKMAINTDYYQFCNGSIVLSEAYYRSYQSSIVLCVANNLGIYSQYRIEIKNRDVKGDTNLAPYGPTAIEAKFNEGFSVTRNKLTAAYDGTMISYHWRKDDFDVFNDFLMNPHELLFPNRIRPHHEGVYTLTIMQNNSRKLDFVYQVRIMGSPILKQKTEYSEVVYLMQGSATTIELLVEGIRLNTKVTINQREIDFTSRKTIVAGISDLKDKFTYLKDFQLSLSISEHRSHTTIYYHITAPSNHRNFLEEFHTLEVVSRNEAGEVRARTIIQTVGKPEAVAKLSYDRTNYLDNVHYFRCAIFHKNYREMGLHVKHFWRINDQNMTKFYRDNNRPINFKEKGYTLLFDNDQTNSAKDIIDNLTLSCSLNLLCKRASADGGLIYKVLYSSDGDQDIAPFLQTGFALQNINFLGHKENMMKVVWWSTLVVVFISSLAITVVMLFCHLWAPSSCDTVNRVPKLGGYQDNAISTISRGNHLTDFDISLSPDISFEESSEVQYDKDVFNDTDCSDEISQQFPYGSRYTSSSFGYPTYSTQSYFV